MKTDEFVLTAVHLKLIKALNIDWHDAEFGAPAVDPKRSYGAGHVLGDIAKVLGWTVIDGELTNYQVEVANRLHREVKVALQVFVQHAELQGGAFECHNYTEWRRENIAGSRGHKVTRLETDADVVCSRCELPIVAYEWHRVSEVDVRHEDVDLCIERSRVALQTLHISLDEEQSCGLAIGDTLKLYDSTKRCFAKIERVNLNGLLVVVYDEEGKPLPAVERDDEEVLPVTPSSP